MSVTNTDGSRWLAEVLSCKKLPPPSDLGRKVADILGVAWSGIYHLPERELLKVRWDSPHYIEVKLKSLSLATYDSDHLTNLVILCHDEAVRFSVDGGSIHTLVLGFWQRVREGRFSERHPTIERAIETTRRAACEKEANGS